MRRALTLILVISATLLLTGCSILSTLVGGHQCEYTDWEITEEPTCSQKGQEERFCIYCDKTQTRDLNKIAHTETDYEGYPATCTEKGKTAGKYCSECLVIISGIQDISAAGHNEVIDPAIPLTDNAPGRTEGKHCSTCGEILIKQMSIFSGNYSTPDRYHGDYAYKSLFELDNGEKMADFYEEIDLAASDFHSSVNDAQAKKNGKNDIYYAAEICFSDNGITATDAISVWSAYVKDHPLYYWISGKITYTDEYITLLVDEEYIDGEVREQINADIYKAVEEQITALEGEADAYGITLGLHDHIIEDADYAYEADGITPSSANSAHNILGVLLEGRGVCESYAKSFQLILNYCDIENIFVTGYSGEPHAWNLVQLDDGQWYWYDLTWDDQPRWMMGVRHNYFCVTDDTIVNWSDGGTVKSTTFIQDHTPDDSSGAGVNYSYTLPERAKQPYDMNGLMLRDEIVEKDGLSYVLIGFKSLALIDIACEGDVIIPETVSHNGDSLRVVCIGKYDSDNGLLTTGSIIEYDKNNLVNLDVTSVSIPKTVRFIWDFAFDNCNSIEGYIVSDENPCFTSKDGVLFTKLLYTLIKYPLAKNQTEYTIPSETVELAFNAFGDGGNVFCPQHLDSLTIPSGIDIIGATGGGYGFRDKAPDDPSDATMATGYLTRLVKMFGFGLKVE